MSSIGVGFSPAFEDRFGSVIATNQGQVEVLKVVVGKDSLLGYIATGRVACTATAGP